MCIRDRLYTLLDRLFITRSPHLEYISYYTISMNIVMLITVVLTGTINVTIPRLSYYPVSYTHLDVYKRQVDILLQL